MKMIKCTKNGFLILLCICLVSTNTITAEATPKTVQLSDITFDADYYYNTYPDLQSTIGYNHVALYNHYIQNGLKEGRSGSAEFNCEAYMHNNSDLCPTFQNDYLSYCIHYEQCGKKEGRNASQPATTRNSEQPISANTETVTTFSKIKGSYSTSYDATIPRAVNVTLAASRINGVTLAPGQEFSFSQTILPRTPANGYVQAPVINNHAYTMGYGGGICQVSSTLYAAMLTVGLPATERHSHSLPVSYMPAGMDATISSPVKDLKFVNIYEHPIQILAITDNTNGIVTVAIAEP